MSDFKISTDTGDLDFSNGDLVLTTGADSIRQHLQQRLLTFKGEWFLDTDSGVPYYQDILQKNPNPLIVDGVLRDVVLGTPGVLELTQFQLLYDAALRSLTLTLSVKSTEGEINFSETLGA